MADDLVQRLRRDGAWLRNRLRRTGPVWMLAYVDSGDAAADALERLQADNQVLSDEVAAHDKELWQGAYTDAVNKKLRAEVVRLQQALRDVLPFAEDVDLLVRNATVSRADAVAAARAVLEGNQQ